MYGQLNNAQNYRNKQSFIISKKMAFQSYENQLAFVGMIQGRSVSN